MTGEDPTAGAARAAATGRPRIGRYEICSEIASGGMGRVYLASVRGPADFEKLVALKTIHPQMAKEAAFLDMFFDEARIAARIAHANVCSVFDFGEADGRYYIAMEYLVGETVGRLLRALSKQPALADDHDVLVARIVAEAAEGLHAAHELRDDQGVLLDVVHRDVSPQNIFVGYDGGVRVVDFGIATARGRLHETSAGSLKGKFAYMAPEQMRREKLDRRTDVWALGVVLWELLTRVRLFRADDELGLMLAVLNEPVRMPSSLRRIDLGLEQIVMKALAKDRDGRYGTARELSSALSRWIVQRGEVVGSAEVAALMDRTFADEKRRAMALVERARGGEADATLDLALLAEAQVPEPVTTLALPVEVASTDPRPSRGRRWPLWAAGVGALALVGVALLAATIGSASGRPSVHGAGAPVAGPAHADAPTPVTSPLPPPSTDAYRVLAPIGDHDATPAAPALAAVDETRDAPAPTAAHAHAAHRDAHAAPMPQTGALHVESPGGWAYVYVDGRRLGRTPLDVELASGTAVVELRPFGLAPLRGDTAIRRTVHLGARPVRVVVPIAP